MAAKGQRKKGKRGRSVRKSGKRRILLTVALLAVVGALSVFGFLVVSGKKGAEVKGIDALQTKSRASSRDFKSLIGRWVRPDGGYVIEIRSVDASGKMDARYYNPNPIHVARAEASKVAGGMEVFVELRDAGYPGATYTLVHNSEKNALVGLYRQPTARQTFSVVFFPQKGP